jgi:hypothetical protein
MTKRIAIEIDIETGDRIERPLTAAEIADMEQITVEEAQQMQAFADKEQKKAALLKKLGITAEEAKLLA